MSLDQAETGRFRERPTPSYGFWFCWHCIDCWTERACGLRSGEGSVESGSQRPSPARPGWHAGKSG